MLDDNRNRYPEINSIAQTQANDSGYREHMREILSIPNENFFQLASEKVASILGVRYVFITECRDQPATRARTLAFWNNDQIVENINYQLDNTPCGKIMEGNTCHYSANIQKRFPKDQDLTSLNVSGYIATPIFGEDNLIVGQPIGLLAVLNQNPLVHTNKIKTILKIFGVKASLELERSDQEERIRYYDGILSTTDDLMAFVDTNYIYKAVSESYSTVFGKPINEIAGKSTLDLHSEGPFNENMKSSVDRSLKGQAANAEFWQCAPDGTDKCILSQHKPFCNAEGEIVGVVVASETLLN